MKISVYPSENPKGSKPFFTANYTPISYLPSFPFSTRILKYLGANPELIQPPLLQGKGKEDELPGTSEWVKIVPVQSSRKTSLGWWDLKQDGVGNGEGIVESLSEHEKWWPGGMRYRIGVKMEKAAVLFGETEAVMQKSDQSKL